MTESIKVEPEKATDEEAIKNNGSIMRGKPSAICHPFDDLDNFARLEPLEGVGR